MFSGIDACSRKIQTKVFLPAEVISTEDNIKLKILNHSSAGELICKASNGIASPIEKRFILHVTCR